MSPRKPVPRPVAPFPAQIRRVREAMGMNQTDFAEQLEVSQQTVSHWEKGIRRPSRRTWVLLKQRLGYSREELEGDEPVRLPDSRAAEGALSAKEVALPPVRKGVAAIRIELKGLNSEPMDKVEAQRTLREALRAGKPIWIVVG